MKKYFIFLIVGFIACNEAYKDFPIIQESANYFQYCALNDIKLKPPINGEWLFHHKEKGQSFDEYTKENLTVFSALDSNIYLQPIGKFDSIQMKALGLTKEFISIFFQAKAILLPTVSDEIIPDTSRRTLNGNQQLNASYILHKYLGNKLPKDGKALLAITALDLYPKKEWNYVFGLASYEKRVGVSSIYRLQDEKLEESNFDLCLSRLINISTHEITHMLKVHHCTHAVCLMNGSNSMEETDKSPNRLCSQCQMKLLWHFKYDNKKRLNELIAFFKINGLKRDYALNKQDFDDAFN
jgi:archaemetzincin